MRLSMPNDVFPLCNSPVRVVIVLVVVSPLHDAEDCVDQRLGYPLAGLDVPGWSFVVGIEWVREVSPRPAAAARAHPPRIPGRLQREHLGKR
jgi:hypothetical protein